MIHAVEGSKIYFPEELQKVFDMVLYNPLKTMISGWAFELGFWVSQ